MTVHMSLPTSGVGLVRPNNHCGSTRGHCRVEYRRRSVASDRRVASGGPCSRMSASVSDVFPTDGNSTVVQVKTVAGARVTTAAHYETTTTTQSAKANRSGLVAITYYIGGATKGYPVLVTVKVQSGSRSGSCRTAYLPV